jgi:hypothetical protein
MCGRKDYGTEEENRRRDEEDAIRHAKEFEKEFGPCPNPMDE